MKEYIKTILQLVTIEYNNLREMDRWNTVEIHFLMTYRKNKSENSKLVIEHELNLEESFEKKTREDDYEICEILVSNLTQMQKCLN